MKESELLSIVIPTRNRSKYLEQCLDLIYISVNRNAIRVHIQDNASTDDTEEVVSRWIARCSLFSYDRNVSDIGPDRNFECALKSVETQYVWLLGDSYTISREGFEAVISLLMGSIDSPLDALIINFNARVKNIEARFYNCSKSLLSDLGWHTTVLSSLIYNRRVIQSADFKRYYDTNFIQTGILFETLAVISGYTVGWLPDVSVENIVFEGQTKVSWQKEALEIWLLRWPSFVLSLPPLYPLEVKLRVIRAHNIKTNVFSYQLLYTLKRLKYPSISKMLRLRHLRADALPPGLIIKAILVQLVPESFFSMIRVVRARLMR